MPLDTIARYASRVARDEAKEVVRVAGLKALFGLFGTVFIVVAAIFVLLALYILLRQEIGDVLAAFSMAGGCLVLALLFLLSSSQVRKRTNPGAQERHVDTPAQQSKTQSQSASPYLLLGAFVLGLLQGEK